MEEKRGGQRFMRSPDPIIVQRFVARCRARQIIININSQIAGICLSSAQLLCKILAH